MPTMPRPFQNPQMSTNSVPKSGTGKKNKTRKETRLGKLSAQKNDRITTCNADTVKNNEKDCKKITSEKRLKRKTRERSPNMIQDIIDGFAFTSFKTVDDLEDFANGVDISVYDSPCSNSSFASTEIQSEDDSHRSSPVPSCSGMVPRASTPYATVESDLPGSPSSQDTLESFPVDGTPSATPLCDLPGTPGRGESTAGDNSRFDQKRNQESPINVDRNKVINKVKKDIKGKKVSCSNNRVKLENHIMVYSEKKGESQENGENETDKCLSMMFKSETKEEARQELQEEQCLKAFVAVNSNQSQAIVTGPEDQEERMDIASPVMDVLTERDSPSLPQDSQKTFTNQPLEKITVTTNGNCSARTSVDAKQSSSPQLLRNINSCNVQLKQEVVSSAVSEACPHSRAVSPIRPQIDRENRNLGNCVMNHSIGEKKLTTTDSGGLEAMVNNKMPPHLLKDSDIKMEVVDNLYPKCEAFRKNNRLGQYPHRPYEQHHNSRVHSVQGCNPVKSEPIINAGYKIPDDKHMGNMFPHQHQFPQQQQMHPNPPQHHQMFKKEPLQQEVNDKVHHHHGNYPVLQPFHLDRNQRPLEGDRKQSVIERQHKYSAADASVSQSQQNPQQNLTSRSNHSVTPNTGGCSLGVQSLHRPKSGQPADVFSKPLHPPTVFNSSRYHSPVPTATHHVTTATVTVSTATTSIGSSPKLTSIGVIPKTSPSSLNLHSRPTTTSHHSNKSCGHPFVNREEPRPIPGVSGTRDHLQPKPIPGISSSQRDLSQQPKPIPGISGTRADYSLLPSFDQIGYQGSSSTYRGATSPYFPFRSPVTTTTTSSSSLSSGSQPSHHTSSHHPSYNHNSSNNTSISNTSKPSSSSLSSLHIPVTSHHHRHPTSSSQPGPLLNSLNHHNHHIPTPNHLPLGPPPSLTNNHHHHHPSPLPLHSCHSNHHHVSPTTTPATPSLSLHSFPPQPPGILSSLATPHISPTLPPTFSNSLTPTAVSFATPLPPSLQPSALSGTHAGGGLGMFAPPLPLALSTAPVPLPSLPPFGGLDALPNSDLHRERLLQDRIANVLPPYIRAEMHSHNHQHVHQHNHNHTHLPGQQLGGASGGTSGVHPLTPPSAGLLTPALSHLKSLPSSSSLPGSSIRPIHGALDKLPPTQYEKMTNKVDGPYPFPSPSAVPGLPGYPNLGPLSGLPSVLPSSSLGSGLQGAFQPKNLGSSASMHPSQMLLSLRDKPPTVATSPASTQPSTTGATVKKPGKWCAAHVRIAWEIHMHQQKQKVEGSRSAELAAPPPGHLPPPPHPHGVGLHRPELATSLLPPGPHERGSLDHTHSSHSAATLLNQARLAGLSPFPRPSPYTLPSLGGAAAAFGAFSSLMPNGLYPSAHHDPLSLGVGLGNPQEWNRLHRTPPSFPQPPATFSKSEAEREHEREALLRERQQRDGSREREAVQRDREAVQRDRELRDKERDREYLLPRHSPLRDHSGRSSLDLERLRDKERSERNSRDSFTERSRSRSPVRNGPLSNLESNLSKLEGSLSSHNSTPVLNNSSSSNNKMIKEERKDDVVVIVDDRVDNTKQPPQLPNGYNKQQDHSKLLSSLIPTSRTSTDHHQHHNLQHHPAVTAAAAAAGYYPPPVSLGNPLDRGRFLPPYGPLWNYDIERQRLDIQREFEKQKDSMLSRFTSVEREKLMEYERHKGLLQHMREVGGVSGGVSAGGHNSATAALMYAHHHGNNNSSPLSVMNNHHHPHSGLLQHHHNKTGEGVSPSTPAGIPPPLIPTTSSSSSSNNSLSSSPVVTKSKPGSPMTQNNSHHPHHHHLMESNKDQKVVLPTTPAVNGIDQESGAR